MTYSIAAPRVRQARLKWKKRGTRKTVLILRGGTPSHQDHRGILWPWFLLFFYPFRPQPTTLYSDSGATVDCTLFSVRPALCWRPIELRFVGDPSEMRAWLNENDRIHGRGEAG